MGLDVIELGRKKKKYRPNIFAMVVMTVITVLLVCAMVSRTSALEQSLGTYEARITSLNREIENANAAAQELEEQRIYMQTTQYIEEIAKNVLGLVEPDEILIVPQN